MAAYYYAFLHTAHQYGSSAFCPIVIDAPIQQGQDQIHLQQIMRLLLDKPPVPSQVIIAIETIEPVANTKIVDVAFEKHHVLRDEAKKNNEAARLWISGISISRVSAATPAQPA